MQLGDFLLGAFVYLAAAMRHFPHLRIFARAFDRAGRAEISKVLSTDRAEANPSADHAWEAPDRTRE